MPPSRACTAWVISLVAGRPRAPRRAQRAVPNASEAARRRGKDTAMARCQVTCCEGRGRGYSGAKTSDVTIVMVVFVLGSHLGVCTRRVVVHTKKLPTHVLRHAQQASHYFCETSFSNKLLFAREKEIFFFSRALRIRRFRGPSIFVWPAFRVSVEIKPHSVL